MVSDGSVPWYNRPPRPFPAQVWARQRYGFTLPPLFFAQPAHAASDGTARRPFPAKVWLEALESPEETPYSLHKQSI